MGHKRKSYGQVFLKEKPRKNNLERNSSQLKDSKERPPTPITQVADHGIKKCFNTMRGSQFSICNIQAAENLPPCDLNEAEPVDEHKYLQFSLEITEEIIRKDLFTNGDMISIIKDHYGVKQRLLDQEKLLKAIEELCIQLHIPYDTDLIKYLNNEVSELKLPETSRHFHSQEIARKKAKVCGISKEYRKGMHLVVAHYISSIEPKVINTIESSTQVSLTKFEKIPRMHSTAKCRKSQVMVINKKHHDVWRPGSTSKSERSTRRSSEIHTVVLDCPLILTKERSRCLLSNANRSDHTENYVPTNHQRRISGDTVHSPFCERLGLDFGDFDRSLHKDLKKNGSFLNTFNQIDTRIELLKIYKNVFQESQGLDNAWAVLVDKLQTHIKESLEMTFLTQHMASLERLKKAVTSSTPSAIDTSWLNTSDPVILSSLTQHVRSSQGSFSKIDHSKGISADLESGTHVFGRNQYDLDEMGRVQSPKYHRLLNHSPFSSCSTLEKAKSMEVVSLDSNLASIQDFTNALRSKRMLD